MISGESEESYLNMYSSQEELFIKAEEFITICYRELNKVEAIDDRLEMIKNEIKHTDCYTHTFEELEHGAKMAWRNSNRCIGRLFWNSLKVFDKRHLMTEDEIFQSLCHHIEYATNDGKIRPAITIFRQDLDESKQVKILNHQLIRYAGYETEFGVIGDSKSVGFTKECEKLGWQGERTHFDILPIVIEVDGRGPTLFSLPKELVLEVEITHPEFTWFNDLQIKWYAVPIISDMTLEIGGITYSGSPFNGWYMGTEIGARNLADSNRYNLLPKIASSMGLPIDSNLSLWKDKALVELNVAVLFSYKEQGISIVDHHTAAQQFLLFEEQEKKCGRPLTGDWTWLIPPVSPATTHIFHQDYKDAFVLPNFYHRQT